MEGEGHLRSRLQRPCRSAAAVGYGDKSVAAFARSEASDQLTRLVQDSDITAIVGRAKCDELLVAAQDDDHTSATVVAHAKPYDQAKCAPLPCVPVVVPDSPNASAKTLWRGKAIYGPGCSVRADPPPRSVTVTNPSPLSPAPRPATS